MTLKKILIDKWNCNISVAGWQLIKKKNKLDYIIINSAEPTHSKSHINVGAVISDIC